MAEIRYKGQIFSGAASFGSADDVSYDNTTSGLTATDVQGAVDEINAHQTHQWNTMLGPLVVGGTTVQIPNFSSLTEDKVVVIYLHRYSYGVSLVVPVKVIRNGDVAGGSTVYLQNTTKYYTVGVSTSGVISLISNHGDGDPYVAITVI